MRRRANPKREVPKGEKLQIKVRMFNISNWCLPALHISANRITCEFEVWTYNVSRKPNPSISEKGWHFSVFLGCFWCACAGFSMRMHAHFAQVFLSLKNTFCGFFCACALISPRRVDYGVGDWVRRSWQRRRSACRLLNWTISLCRGGSSIHRVPRKIEFQWPRDFRVRQQWRMITGWGERGVRDKVS